MDPRSGTRRWCVKIRVNSELKRADYNLILQLLKRTLERYERTGETSAASSQQGIEVQAEPLTERSEKIPFEVIDGIPMDTTGSEWVNAQSIGDAAGKSSQEISEMFRAGIEYDYDERGRIFVKYAPPAKPEDPYARLTSKIHDKVSQTKIPAGTRTAKFLWIDSPYDLRTLDHQVLQQQAVREMSRSSHTLGVAITHREGSPHFRHYYSMVGVLNQNGLPDLPNFAATLESLRAKEIDTDPITGWKYQGTWEEAQVRAEREIKQLEALRKVNIEGNRESEK